MWFDYNGCSALGTISSVASDGSSVTVTTPNIVNTASEMSYPCPIAVPQGQGSIVTNIHITGYDPNGIYYDTRDFAASQAQYTFQSLQVTSVRDEATGTNSGSILGGDTVDIFGSGFEEPSGGSLHVCFTQTAAQMAAAGSGGVGVSDCLLSTTDGTVTVDSPEQLSVTVPNYAGEAAHIPSGQSAFDADVQVDILDASDNDVDSPINPGDEFDFELPQVDSVRDEATGTNSGSILGGDTVDIFGSGFEQPRGGSVTVCFNQTSAQAAATGVAPATQCPATTDLNTVTIDSDEQLTVTSPELADEVNNIPTGQSDLETDVIVMVSDAQVNVVVSPMTPQDIYDFDLPQVNSVSDVTSGNGTSSSGSILGGDALSVAGSGFVEPPGGSANVLFEVNGKTVKTVPVSSMKCFQIGCW